MSLLTTLKARADNRCELTQSPNNLVIYPLPPECDEHDADRCILVSQTCYDQLTGVSALDASQWRGLSDAMWSTVPAVQVVAYRQLQVLSAEPWAQDCLDMLYLTDEIQAWAEAAPLNDNDITPTQDANGTILVAGDSVTLIKDLPVKGAGFTAKRGTAVRNISLTDNPEHIEGRVNGQRIVLVAKFLKKM